MLSGCRGTELRAHAEVAGAAKVRAWARAVLSPISDPAAGEGIECRRVACEAPQHLSESAVPYLVLRRRDGEGENAPLDRV